MGGPRYNLDPKCPIACLACRERKVKCSGQKVCGNCRDRDVQCIYPKTQRRKRPRVKDQVIHLQNEVSRLKLLLNSATTAAERTFHSPSTWAHPQSIDAISISQNGIESSREERPISRSTDVCDPGTVTLPHCSSPSGQSQQPSVLNEDNYSPQASYTASVDQTATLPELVSGELEATEDYVAASVQETRLDKEESIIDPKQVNWEHHGAGSWISIASLPGIKWVNGKLRNKEFSEYSQQLMMTWTGRLKLEPTSDRRRAPEPVRETAFEYAKAYFEECHDLVFGIVSRTEFESRLDVFFQQQLCHGPPDKDLSWYALRNSIYALGCRALLSNNPSSQFMDAQKQSWPFFENALSVLTGLLCYPTGLIAVQAVTLMTVYVEGLGSPALEYMLSSNATRLAISKGLHRRPTIAWSLSEGEIQQMRYLFWAIYYCDKQLARRSGRPSAIDDTDVSCMLPKQPPPGDGTLDFNLAHQLIRSSQVTSQVLDDLRPLGQLLRGPESFLRKMADLDLLLDEFRDSLPSHLRPGLGVKPSMTSPRGRNSTTQVLCLHFTYFGCRMAIHTTLAYPWVAAAMFGDQLRTDVFRKQTTRSVEIVAESARSIILALRHIEINAATPAWLAFYYPMVGLINLFVCILQQPLDPSTESNIASLEIAAGYFAQMELTTSGAIVVPFTRQAARMARRAVQCATEKSDTGLEGHAVGIAGEDLVSGGGWGAEDIAMGGICDQTSDADPSHLGTGGVDFDLDNVNVLLPALGDEFGYDFSFGGDKLPFLDEMPPIIDED